MPITLAWGALMAVGGWAGPLAAQSDGSGFRVEAVQPLDFGEVIPGETRDVAVTDVDGRAEVILLGSGSATLHVSMVSVFRGRALDGRGDGLRIEFLPRHGAISLRPDERPTHVDLTGPVRITVPPDHDRIHLYIGGRISSRTDVGPGEHTFEISVTVVDTEG